MNSLHAACKVGDIQKIYLLLIQGADVNEKDSEGFTPIQHSLNYRALYETNTKVGKSIKKKIVEECCKSMMEMLLCNGASLSVQNQNGQTPLHIIADKSYSELIKVVARYGPDVNARDNRGKTPLHYCVKNENSLPTLMILTLHCDVNAIDNNDETPLHAAVTAGHQEVCDILMANNADINKKNKQGRTPIDLALLYRDSSLVKLFLDNKANVSTEHLETSVLLATISNVYEHIDSILNRDETLHLECIINFRDKYGCSLLHIAVKYADATIVKRFLEIGLDINTLDSNDRTPLFQLVNYLFNSHKNVNKTVSSRHLEITSNLLHYHPDITKVPNGANKSIQDIILSGNEPRMEEIILQYISSMKVAGFLDKYDYTHPLPLYSKYYILHCRHEIEIMKKIMENGLSLYHLLLAPIDKLAVHLKNPSIYKFLTKDYKKKFPVYWYFIDSHVKLAQNRNNLMYASYEFFYSIMNTKPLLPHLCIEKIISLLEVNDLHKLCFLINNKKKKC